MLNEVIHYVIKRLNKKNFMFNNNKYLITYTSYQLLIKNDKHVYCETSY